MVTWLDVLAKQQQYQDLLNRAEHHRLINTVLQRKQRRQRLFYLVSNWLIGLLP